MRPTYIRSSTSTVNGKKSIASRGLDCAVVADSNMESPSEVDGRRTGGLPGQQARLETDDVATEVAVVDDGFQ